MGEPEENARNSFFEQLLTVRMPTAGPAVSIPTAQDDPANQDTEQLTSPLVEQLSTERLAVTHPPASVRASAHPAISATPDATRPTLRQLTGAPAIAEARTANATLATLETADTAITPLAPAEAVATHARGRRRPSRHTRARARRSPQRRLITAIAFTVILLVVALVPVLYYLSSSQSARMGHTNGFAQGANPPAGWHPQNWATVARQQAELRYVNKLIANMSLDQEIGQMIMLGFLETQMSPSLAYSIKQFHLGSVVLYAWNITGATQVKQLTSQIQAEGDMPLLIATDQEGGSVNRLQAIDGPLPGAWAMAANGTTAFAHQRGVQDAQQLHDLGINFNFAPVVDVANTSGGDLSGRTFGSTPAQVTALAGAYLSGLQSSGQVIGTLKHFPGLGDVPADPHKTLFTLNRSETELEQIDWAPYRALIATGQVQAIMSTHVILSAIDPALPASMSYPVLTGILRDKLGYQGVIITDGIYMGAVSSNYPFDQIILDSVKAGNDIICSTYSIATTAEAIRVLKDAVQSGEISKSRIDDSVRRILLLKLHNGVLTLPQSQG